MSFKQLIKQHFNNVIIGEHSVVCKSPMIALSIIDLMIRSAFDEHIPENFDETTTKIMLLETLKEVDTLLKWGVDKYNNKDVVLRKLLLEDDTNFLIDAFAFVRDIQFRVENFIVGKGELIDIHLYKSKYGWVVRQSFPLDD